MKVEKGRRSDFWIFRKTLVSFCGGKPEAVSCCSSQLLLPFLPTSRLLPESNLEERREGREMIKRERRETLKQFLCFNITNETVFDNDQMPLDVI